MTRIRIAGVLRTIFHRTLSRGPRRDSRAFAYAVRAARCRPLTANAQLNQIYFRYISDKGIHIGIAGDFESHVMHVGYAGRSGDAIDRCSPPPPPPPPQNRILHMNYEESAFCNRYKLIAHLPGLVDSTRDRLICNAYCKADRASTALCAQKFISLIILRSH